MSEAGCLILGLVLGGIAGFCLAWWAIITICDHFVGLEREKLTEQTRRAELYKKIAEDLKAQIEFPEFISER